MLAAAQVQAGHVGPRANGAGLLQPFGRFHYHGARHFHAMRMAPAGKPRHRNAPEILHPRIQFRPRLKHRHLLHRTHHRNRAAVELAHVILVLVTPPRRIRRCHSGELDRQPDEFVGQHGAAAQTRIAVIEIADGDAGPRSHIVVSVVIEQPHGARIGVPLQVAAHPVVAVPQAVGMQSALRIQQQARGFDGARAHHHQPRRLRLQVAASVEVGHRGRVSARIQHNLPRHRIGAQFAQASRHGGGNHRVLRAVLGVDFAGEPHAPAAPHARPAAIIGYAVAQHRNVERMPALAQRRRLQNFVFAVRR